MRINRGGRGGPGGPEHSVVLLARLVGAGIMAGVLVAFIALPMVGSAGLAARDASNNFENMPINIDTSPPPEKTVVQAADGTTLATFFDEYRESVRLDKVAPIMRKAIIAIEDSRFYQHGALDLKGAIRALATNAEANEVRQGGSTLTQQYVKNLLIENAKTPEEKQAARAQTVGRKLRELRYALHIEQRMSKDQILEGYLNVAYFGAGAYGVQAAAKRYFSKPAAKLNLAESAMLAGITNSPFAYDPTIHPGAARQRRNIVLARMAQLGVVSQKAADKAAASPVRLDETKPSGGCDASKAPFFCTYIRNEMINILSRGKKSQVAAATQQLQRGGYTIRTTLDWQAPRPARAARAQRRRRDHDRAGHGQGLGHGGEPGLRQQQEKAANRHQPRRGRRTRWWCGLLGRFDLQDLHAGGRDQGGHPGRHLDQVTQQGRAQRIHRLQGPAAGALVAEQRGRQRGRELQSAQRHVAFGEHVLRSAGKAGGRV